MRIAMPRGDIRYVRFLINNPNGTGADVDFSEIYFTVKKKFSDRLFCFQKRLSTGGIVKLDTCDYQIKIEPSDTNMMYVGDFVFDIQLDYTYDGIEVLKETFVGDFVLKPEVTYPENE
jgi:hypothetical protein